MIKQLILSIILALCVSSEMLAEENVLLSRAYWKANPTIAKVKMAIAEGNDPSALNENAFDAVVYALLEKTNEDVIKYLLSLEGNTIEKRTHDSRTYIFWAAYKGNVEIMKYLFNKGALINIRDSHGNTPIIFAAASGQTNINVYDLFEKQGAVLKDEVNEDGVNALFLVAPYLESDKALSYFISKGFNVKDKDPIGNTLFNYAAKKGDIHFLKLLIEKGIDPTVRNKYGGNAMLYASQGTRNHENTLETYQFLASLGVIINVVGDKGRNPLHAIAYNSDDISIFNYFIEKGVAVNLQDVGGDTPFMNAANSNKLSVVKFLSDFVEDINLKDKNGRSALAMAVNRNTIAVVQLLLKQGAAINTKDKNGNSLAFYLLNTFKKNESKVFESKLELLTKEGLSMNQTQNKGNTLLHITSQKNNLLLLKRLMKFKIPINSKNEEGYTALHIAAMKTDNALTLKYLLSQGANKTIKTEFEETVFDLASENELLQKQDLKFLQ
ncbi:MAG: ankyrin repeat protein [Flavobacteriales bacterium]|jgi:ankyrin repeat protein|uniref:ankyrin repeat domain-containing protein n=1 Tax=Patiriisocius sp. Uisw_047 TaxID=3230969 RepID=UPI0039E97051